MTDSNKIVYIDWDTLISFMTDAFVGCGVPREEAEICADVLAEADRRGIDSHGCNRFKPIYIDRFDNGTLLPRTDIEILRETPTTLVMDAHDGMGMVASYRMMEKLIEKAKAFGMAGGAIRNSTHYGIAGYWSNMAAKEGLIGLTGTNARPSIAPTYGVENMMGTNPLVFSLPTDEEFPFCIDCATSVVQRGKIEFYARQGKDTPAGQVISQDGTAMTDSEEILKALVSGTAALAPLGGIGDEMAGYKGYGYAAVVEILSAALAGGQYMKALSGRNAAGEPEMYHLGHFFFVIDPDAFMGQEEFRKIAEISAGHSEHPEKLRDMTVFIQPVRRNTLPGWTEKTKVFQSTHQKEKILQQSEISSACHTNSAGRNNNERNNSRRWSRHKAVSSYHSHLKAASACL